MVFSGALQCNNFYREKTRGIPHNIRKNLDFIAIIKACGLMDIGFSGQKYTWSNNRGMNHSIWKRLDRGLNNDTWLDQMPQQP